MGDSGDQPHVLVNFDTLSDLALHGWERVRSRFLRISVVIFSRLADIVDLARFATACASPDIGNPINGHRALPDRFIVSGKSSIITSPGNRFEFNAAI